MPAGTKVVSVIATAVTGLVLCTTQPARADDAAEQYVAQNATHAIELLDSAGAAAERSTKFGELMDQFADMPGIADFVLGAYARTLRADPALKAEWNGAFRAYAINMYERSFNDLRDSSVQVTGSRDWQVNGRTCSRVATDMKLKSREPSKYFWYLCKEASDADWKVTDVGVLKGDSELKLTITLRDQFVAFLGANSGNVRALIARLNTQLATMGKIASKD